jgi:transposase-like protein
MSIIEVSELFPDDIKATELFENVRWANGVYCAYCQSQNITKKYSDNRHRCKDCRKGFSVTTNTHLHNTRLSLHKWLFAFSIISDAKKGLSSLQLQRNLKINYEAAFYMAHTIRDIMAEEKVELLNDVIEMDETYVGGKPRKPNVKKLLTKEGKEYLVNRTQEVKALGYDLTALKGNTAKVDLDTKRGRGSQKLIPVTGIVQRDGAVIAEVMDSLGAKKLEAMVKKHVALADTLLITDTYKGYSRMKKIIEHIKIDHSRLYSYNGVNTNSIESFWSIVERGIIGQYHHVSLKYLPKYVVEFCFKYNNRNFDDMFETLVKASMNVQIPKAIIHDPTKPKPVRKPRKKGHLGTTKPKNQIDPKHRTKLDGKMPF